MSEAEQSPVSAPTAKCRSIKRAALVVFALLLVGLAAAWVGCPWILRMRAGGASQGLAQTEQRLAALERQVQALDVKFNELGAQAGKKDESGNAESGAPSAASLARMQGDLITLSSAVGTLQAELKKTDNVAAHTQQAAQSSLASAIAFIQLRETAEAGRGFATELAALRSAARSDSGVQDMAGKLEPYALKGVPTFEALREEFIALEAPAATEIDKSAAQNWHQRLIAELKGLVSIRPLHGAPTADAFTAAEEALASGDLSAALVATGNLPPAAQETLKDWRTKAEAREAVEATLHALVDHFIASAAPVSAPNAQDEP